MLHKQHRRRNWRTVFTGMAAVVTFVTVYMLILPAITMERPTYCGMQEHVHTDECYRVDLICTQSEEAVKALVCTLAEDENHTHTDECYQEQKHVHGPECYERVLICELPEHTHTDECWVPEYICGKEEHTHTEECYDEAGELICETEEHTHGEECVKQEEPAESAEPEYVCGKEEHTHTEECYDEAGELVCETEEHTHGEECVKQEEPAEPAEPAEPEYVCGKDEHTHTDECFDEEGNLVCEIEEHTHGEECLKKEEPAQPEGPQQVYICGKEEHAHAGECFDEEGNLVCEMEEHVHGEECVAYCICGKAEHTHGEECFDEEGNLVCETEEHTHQAACLLTRQSVAAQIVSAAATLGLDEAGKPGVTVAGFLPGGAVVTAEPVEVEGMVFAFDINIFDANGEKYEPIMPVEVIFAVPGITDDPERELAAYHVPVEDENAEQPVYGEPELWESEVTEEGTLVATVPHFSVVAVGETESDWSCCELDDYLTEWSPCDNNTPFGGAQAFNLFLLGDMDGWNAVHGNAAIGGDIKGVNGGIGFPAGSNFDYEANVTAERDIALLLGGDIATTAPLQVANGSAIIKEEIVTREDGNTGVQIELDNTGNPKGHYHEIPSNYYYELDQYFGWAGKNNDYHSYAESLLEHNDHINRYAMDLQTGKIVDGHLGMKTLVSDLSPAEKEAYLGKQEETNHSASGTDLVLHGENMFYNVFNVKSSHIQTIGGQSRRLYLDVPDGSYVLVNIIGRNEDDEVVNEITDFGLQFWYRDSEGQWKKQPAKIKAMQSESYDQSQMVLVNIAPEITKMEYTTSDGNYFYASILAPRVDMISKACNLQGTIVFNSLNGNNQCNIVYSPFYVGASMTLSKETYCDTPDQNHSKVNISTGNTKCECEIVEHDINGSEWEPYFADVKFRVSTAPGEDGDYAVKRELPMAGYRADGKPFTIEGISPGYYTVADEVVYFKAHNDLPKDDPEYKERRLTVDKDGYYMVAMYLRNDFSPDSPLVEDLNVNEWTLVYCNEVKFNNTAPQDERWTCSIDESAKKWTLYDEDRTAEEKEELGLVKCEDEKLFYALGHHWNYAAFRAPNGEIVPTVTIQSGQNLEGYTLMNHYGLDPAKTVTVYKSWGEWKEVVETTPPPAADTPSLLILDKETDGTRYHWFNVAPPVGAKIGATLSWSTEKNGSYTEVTAEDVPGIVNPLIITEKTDWSGMWTDLPETKQVNGKDVPVYYMVDETTEWPGYTYEGAENNVGDAWVLKNSPLPEPAGSLTVTKKWANANGSPMTAEQIEKQGPVTVNLYRREGTVPKPYIPNPPEGTNNDGADASVTKSITITIDNPRHCGVVPHTHTDSCYTPDGTTTNLTCGYEAHAHSESCRGTAVLEPKYFVTAGNGSDLTVTLQVWLDGDISTGFWYKADQLKLTGTGAEVETISVVADTANKISTNYQKTIDVFPYVATVYATESQSATPVSITAKLKNASTHVSLHLTGPATQSPEIRVTAPLITAPLVAFPQVKTVQSLTVDRYDPAVVNWDPMITFAGDISGASQTLSENNTPNKWVYTWDDLPLFDSNDPLRRYGYYAIEEVPDGFVPSYLYSSTGVAHDGSFKEKWEGNIERDPQTPPTDANGNDVPAVASGFITIRNTAQAPGYILPETGGAGTARHMAAGLMLMCGAAAAAAIKRRKGVRRTPE